MSQSLYRFMFDLGIGIGKAGVLPTDKDGGTKRITELPEEPGPLRNAFDRVYLLSVFFSERALAEGRVPSAPGGERGVRLRKLMGVAQKAQASAS